jgi:hypothetical protein
MFITRKKVTDNFMVRTDITLVELETELYRWMGISSSTHGLDTCGRCQKYHVFIGARVSSRAL